jgi:hypothetical protein
MHPQALWPLPYRWVDPPADQPTSNEPPASLHQHLTVGSAGTAAATADRQVTLYIEPVDRSVTAAPFEVRADITPTSSNPIQLPTRTDMAIGNQYYISYSTPVAVKATLLIRGPMTPTRLYTSTDDGRTWHGASGARPFGTDSIEWTNPTLNGRYVLAASRPAPSQAGPNTMGGGRTVTLVVLLLGATGASATLLRRRHHRRGAIKPRNR